MIEDVFSVPMGDGYSLHGRINYADEETDKAVIFCHGLTGHMYEHPYMTARVFFAARGYDVIRFNFYGDESDARPITDCTVALHAEDLLRLLTHFVPKYRNLYVAGHSYGGLAILMANPPQVSAVSLWDGTFIPFAEDESFSAPWFYNKELGEYMVNWPPIARVVGNKFYDETRSFTTPRMTQWAADFYKPAQVLAAGGFTENMPYQAKLFDELASKEKEFTPIAGAGHGFNEGVAVFDLLENTHRWFERFQ